MGEETLTVLSKYPSCLLTSLKATAVPLPSPSIQAGVTKCVDGELLESVSSRDSV